MQSLLKSLVLIITVAVLGACGVAPQNNISDDPGSRSSANTTRPVVHSTGGWLEVVGVSISANSPALIAQATENAITAWNEAAGTDVLVFLGVAEEVTSQSSLYSTLDDKVTTIYFDNQNWAGHTGKPTTTLATTVWENDPRNSSVIVRGDIILNAQHYVYIDGLDASNAELDEESLVDAESVIVHEMGHLLGLDHVNVYKDRDSVMHAQTYIGYGVANRVPSSGDAQLIQSIYAEK